MDTNGQSNHDDEGMFPPGRIDRTRYEYVPRIVWYCSCCDMRMYTDPRQRLALPYWNDAKSPLCGNCWSNLRREFNSLPNV